VEVPIVGEDVDAAILLLPTAPAPTLTAITGADEARRGRATVTVDGVITVQREVGQRIKEIDTGQDLEAHTEIQRERKNTRDMMAGRDREKEQNQRNRVKTKKKLEKVVMQKERIQLRLLKPG
jgi:microcompartment protein CcmL/EutN